MTDEFHVRMGDAITDMLIERLKQRKISMSGDEGNDDDDDDGDDGDDDLWEDDPVMVTVTPIPAVWQRPKTPPKITEEAQRETCRGRKRVCAHFGPTKEDECRRVEMACLRKFGLEPVSPTPTPEIVEPVVFVLDDTEDIEIPPEIVDPVVFVLDDTEDIEIPPEIVDQPSELKDPVVFVLDDTEDIEITEEPPLPHSDELFILTTQERLTDRVGTGFMDNPATVAYAYQLIDAFRHADSWDEGEGHLKLIASLYAAADILRTLNERLDPETDFTLFYQAMYGRSLAATLLIHTNRYKTWSASEQRGYRNHVNELFDLLVTKAPRPSFMEPNTFFVSASINYLRMYLAHSTSPQPPQVYARDARKVEGEFNAEVEKTIDEFKKSYGEIYKRVLVHANDLLLSYAKIRPTPIADEKEFQLRMEEMRNAVRTKRTDFTRDQALGLYEYIEKRYVYYILKSLEDYRVGKVPLI